MQSWGRTICTISLSVSGPHVSTLLSTATYSSKRTSPRAARKLPSSSSFVCTSTGAQGEASPEFSMEPQARKQLAMVSSFTRVQARASMLMALSKLTSYCDELSMHKSMRSTRCCLYNTFTFFIMPWSMGCNTDVVFAGRYTRRMALKAGTFM
uniref:Uncharacterized protein n=1 Tax=Rhipicephalus microplus TaxID=6941 RepID=A0A6G5A8J5_RHIMP